MFFILSKILSVLLKPAFYFVSLLTLYPFLKSDKWKKRVFIGILLLLWFFGNKGFILLLMKQWEEPSVNLTELPRKQVAVVLGGMGYYNEDLDQLTLTRGGNRIWQGMLVYGSHITNYLVISGSNGSIVEEYSEALLLQDDIIEMGFNPNKVLVESSSKNTYENATYTKKLIEDKRLSKDIILITSALHMKRSKAIFEKQGFTVTPYSSDPYTGEAIPWYQFLFPQMESYHLWDAYLHEVLGYIVYDMKEYL